MTWNTVTNVLRSVTPTSANQRPRNCPDDQSEDSRSHKSQPIIRPDAWQLSHYCDDIVCHDTFWFSVFLGISVLSLSPPLSLGCHHSRHIVMILVLGTFHEASDIDTSWLLKEFQSNLFSLRLSVCPFNFRSICLFLTCLVLKIFILGPSIFGLKYFILLLWPGVTELWYWTDDAADVWFLMTAELVSAPGYRLMIERPSLNLCRHGCSRHNEQRTGSVRMDCMGWMQMDIGLFWLQQELKEC